jgi:hypothetical protein
MLHDRSAQIVELARLGFVCTDNDCLVALPSTQYRLRLPFNLRAQAFTPKVGGPVHRDGRHVSRASATGPWWEHEHRVVVWPPPASNSVEAHLKIHLHPGRDTAGKDFRLYRRAVNPYHYRVEVNHLPGRHRIQMVVRSWKSATSLLLVSILLGASLAPPGIRHSHPISEGVGIRHHGHDTASSPSGEHDRQDTSWSGHREDQTSDVAQLGETRHHVHFHVLGLEITFPDPVPAQDDDGSQAVVEWMTLAAGEQPLPGHSVNRGSFPQDSVQPAAILPMGDAALTEAKASPPPPVACAPLCDSARRERSGVLRA